MANILKKGVGVYNKNPYPFICETPTPFSTKPPPLFRKTLPFFFETIE